MSQNDISETVEELAEEFEAVGIEIDTEDAEERLEELTEFRVPLDEAKTTVRSSLMGAHDVSSSDLYQPDDNELVAVEDIAGLISEADGEDIWIDVEVTILDEWEPKHPSIGQVGLAGDSSGTIKYTSFKTSELPDVQEGVSYSFSNVVASAFEKEDGDTIYEIKPNSNSSITELDEEIEVPSAQERNSHSVSGTVVAIKPGSGLIERCSEEDCNRVLNSGQCAVHGEVDGEDDLRIKAVVDDGDEAHDVIFGTEETVEILGMGIEAAVKEARNAMDKSVITDMLETEFVGQHVEADAAYFDDSGLYLVNEYTLDAELDEDGISEAAMRGRDLIEA